MAAEMNDPHFVTSRAIVEDGGGWEFSCQACGYQARYTLGNGKSLQKFQILCAGDPYVRHTSQGVPGANLDETRPEEFPADTELYDGTLLLNAEAQEETAWLTPEISEILDRILKKLDD